MTEKFNAVTITLGVLALVALVLAGVLAIANHPLEAVVLFLGISSTCVGVLAPSPVPKPPVQPVNVVNTPAAPVPVSEPVQPGYQPDTQSSDQAAKAQRLAHAREVLLNGSMSGRADADVFRSDMRRAAAASFQARPPSVPSPGVVTGGRELYGAPAGWESKLGVQRIPGFTL